MANEITLRAQLSVTHAGTTVTGDTTKSLSIGTDGEKGSNRQPTTTVAADIDLGSISWSEVSALYLKNASTVTGEDIIISKSGTDIIRLKPGVPAVFSPEADGTALQARSATGTPGLDVAATGALA